MSIPNDNSNSIAGSLSRQKRHSESPVREHIKSGIYRAITTGQPDPEGRGRLAAYIPALGGDPDNPLFFQYASPFGGSNGGGSYGFFSVPPDAGVTIMVFFAEGGEISESYWFAVTQEVHNVAAGGPAGTARNDGTGQGEGTFSDVPAAGTVADDLNVSRDPSVQGGYDEAGMGLGSSTAPAWTMADAQEVERLRSFNEDVGGGRAMAQLTPSERAYAEHMGYMSPRTDPLDAFGGAGEDVSTTSGSSGDPDSDDPRGRDQRGTGGSGGANDPSNTRPNHGRNVNTAAQGIYSDSVRGQTTGSPQRNASFETPQPSSTYGWRTPGSNSIMMDDGIISDQGEIHHN